MAWQNENFSEINMAQEIQTDASELGVQDVHFIYLIENESGVSVALNNPPLLGDDDDIVAKFYHESHLQYVQDSADRIIEINDGLRTDIVKSIELNKKQSANLERLIVYGVVFGFIAGFLMSLAVR